jgi:hypothetical protein
MPAPSVEYKGLKQGSNFLIEGDDEGLYSHAGTGIAKSKLSKSEYYKVNPGVAQLPTLTKTEHDDLLKRIVEGGSARYGGQFASDFSGQIVKSNPEDIRNFLGRDPDPSKQLATRGQELRTRPDLIAKPGSGTYPEDVVKGIDQQMKAGTLGPNDQVPQNIVDQFSSIQQRIASEGITDASGKVLQAPATPSATTLNARPGIASSDAIRRNERKAEIEKIKQSLGLGNAPTAPDLFTNADKLRLNLAQQERTKIDNELAGILNERLQIEEEFKKFSRSAGEGVTESSRAGIVSEKTRELQDRLDSLNRRELVLETKLRNRNTVISELMGAQRQEYEDAVNLYNSQFAQAMQVYQLFDKEQSELKQNAKANLDVLTKAYGAQIESGKLTFEQISGVQQAKLEEYELQAGLPLGSTMAILQSLRPGEEKLYSGVDDFGNFVYITKDANGSINTNKIPGAVRVSPKGTGTGLTEYQQTQAFLNVSNKYQADSIINQAVNGQTAVAIADQVIANPSKATAQLKSLYLLVKNLDPTSAVREGELALANSTQSYLQQFSNSLARLNEGRVLDPQAAVELAEATKELASAWNATAQRRQKQYQAQAQTIGVGGQFGAYLGGYESNFANQGTGQADNLSDEEAWNTFQEIQKAGATNLPAQQFIGPYSPEYYKQLSK